MIKKVLFIKIANLTIKIVFSNPEAISNRLEKEILFAFKNNIQSKNLRKCDFTVIIEPSKNYTIDTESITGGDNCVYLKYFSFKKNTITTFDYISIDQFSFILRYWTIKLLTQKDGMAIHCSAVNVRGKAYLFLGNSGAGKSTIMHFLSNNYLPIADDTGYILKKNNKFFFAQSPFFEKEGDVVLKRNIILPVEKIIFIRKSKQFRLIKLREKGKILEKILPQIFRSKEEAKAQHHNIFNFVNSHQEFYCLYFDKDEKQLLRFFTQKAESY